MLSCMYSLVSELIQQYTYNNNILLLSHFKFLLWTIVWCKYIYKLVMVVYNDENCIDN